MTEKYNVDDRLKSSGQPDYNDIFALKLSDKTFHKFKEFAYSTCGIKLIDAKKIMVESRLRKRLRQLKLKSFDDYAELLLSLKNEEELINFINLISTNKTEFFREERHFQLLKQFVLDKIENENQKHFNLWSAACSSGEEPYTMAIVMEEIKNLKTKDSISYKILASDISTAVLEKAALAIYDKERLINFDQHLLKKYFMRSKDPSLNLYRVVPELREKINFKRINLKENYRIDDYFDFIFCRNVLIYFDRETQLAVVKKLIEKLKTNGYLFLGHSEALFELREILKPIAPSVYLKYY